MMGAGGGGLAVFFFSTLVFFAEAASQPGCERTFGYAYEFMYGTHGIIDYTPPVEWFDYSEFTFQFWMKTYSVSTTMRQGLLGGLVEKEKTAQYYNAAVHIIDDELHFLAGSDFHNHKNVFFPLSGRAFSWIHITATFDRDDRNGTSRLYVDGDLVAEESNQGPCNIVAMPFLIGTSSSGENFRGLLDEVRAFDFAMTPEEVNETWAAILTGNEQGLYFYFTADGDELHVLKDRSPNGRDTAFVRISATDGANARVSFRADCVGCFNSSSSLAGYCLPLDEETQGICGDGLVLGDELCDGGEGCLPNCTCSDGYLPRNLPYCLKNIAINDTADTCDWATSLAMCISALEESCDCACMNKTGISVLRSLGCDGTNTPQPMYVTWAPCLKKCPWDTYVCQHLLPERCSWYVEQERCTENGCFWCMDACMTQEADCPVICGNGVVQNLEECDDRGNEPGDGCNSQCLVERGWNCTGTAPSICFTSCGDSIIAGNETCEGQHSACIECTLQPGWMLGADGTFVEICGDGILVGEETCDDGNTDESDGCSSECVVEDGWSCSETVPSICTRNSLGVAAIAGIVTICICSVTIVSALVMFLVVRQRRRRRRSHNNKCTASSKKDAAEEFADVAIEDLGEEAASFDPTKSAFLDQEQFPIKASPSTLSFGLHEEGERAQIDVPLFMYLRLSNSGSSRLNWRLFPIRTGKFSITFSPSEGKLSKGASAILQARLVVHCTTRLQLQVVLAATHPRNEEKKHTFLALAIESKLSTRLDPDEIQLLQPPIGEGSFGTVFRGTYRTQDVACKVLKAQWWGDKINNFHREMRAMEELLSPFVVKFIGAVVIPGRICIVTEFVQRGSLAQLLHTVEGEREIPQLLRVRMCLDAARGIAYLHSCKMLHRDLKADNLLVVSVDPMAPVVCKLSDMGSTREIGEETTGASSKGTGTTSYTAPEVLETGTGFSVEADVFSLGVVMHEIVTGKVPFSDIGQPWQIADHVIKGGRMPIPDDCPEPLRQLIQRCWSQQPHDRPQILDVVAVLEKDLFSPLIAAVASAGKSDAATADSARSAKAATVACEQPQQPSRSRSPAVAADFQAATSV